MADIVVRVDEDDRIEFETIDVAVAGEAIEFSVEGEIRADPDAFARVCGGSLTPTAIHFDFDFD